MLTIIVVSDATGETAERVVRSALVQFDSAPAEVLRRGHIRTPEEVREVVQEAKGRECFILHTLVSDELRRLMRVESRAHGVDAMDLMGPVLDRLSFRLNLTPQEKPGLFSQLAEARTRTVEAVEYAFRHDDGQHPDELERAEIVLVGVSRTMKTPTTLYLAYRGWFAANVPLVPGVPPPISLLRLDTGRVFCLVMSASRLAELRRVRAEHLGLRDIGYAAPERLREELAASQELARDRGWRLVEVTGKSVEVGARVIVDLVEVGGGSRSADL